MIIKMLSFIEDLIGGDDHVERDFTQTESVFMTEGHVYAILSMCNTVSATVC